jgi:hypothetical protein
MSFLPHLPIQGARLSWHPVIHPYSGWYNQCCYYLFPFHFHSYLFLSPECYQMFPSHQMGRCFTFVLLPPSCYSYLKLHNAAVSTVVCVQNITSTIRPWQFWSYLTTLSTWHREMLYTSIMIYRFTSYKLACKIQNVYQESPLLWPIRCWINPTIINPYISSLVCPNNNCAISVGPYFDANWKGVLPRTFKACASTHQ